MIEVVDVDDRGYGFRRFFYGFRSRIRDLGYNVVGRDDKS